MHSWQAISNQRSGLACKSSCSESGQLSKRLAAQRTKARGEQRRRLTTGDLGKARLRAHTQSTATVFLLAVMSLRFEPAPNTCRPISEGGECLVSKMRTMTTKEVHSETYITLVKSGGFCVSFCCTYNKIGTIQRRLAWPLRKDDTQIREAFLIFSQELLGHSPLSPLYRSRGRKCQSVLRVPGPRSSSAPPQSNNGRRARGA